MQDYAHKDKVLRGFEGVWHNWKASRETTGGREIEIERTKSAGPGRMRICTTDGFLIDSGNEKTSLEKSMFVSFRSRKSIEDSWTSSCLEEFPFSTIHPVPPLEPTTIRAIDYGRRQSCTMSAKVWPASRIHINTAGDTLVHLFVPSALPCFRALR